MSKRNAGRDLQVGGEPRVQLLPPIVRQREQSRRVRRMLVFTVLVAVAVALGGTAFGYLRSVQAQASLATAQDLTVRILAEQSRFTEATRMARLVEDTEAARRAATENEVDWRALVQALVPHLPEGVTIATIALHAPAPWEGALLPEGELRADRIALAGVTLSGDYAQAAAFVTAVAGMEGVADVYIDGTTFEEGAYRTAITIALDADARTGRFVEVEAEDSGDDPTTEAGDEQDEVER